MAYMLFLTPTSDTPITVMLGSTSSDLRREQILMISHFFPVISALHLNSAEECTGVPFVSTDEEREVRNGPEIAIAYRRNSLKSRREQTND